MNSLGLVEAAAFLRVHPNTLRDRAKTKRIPGAKVGREWVFIKEDLVAYLRQQYEEGTPCLSTKDQIRKSGGSTFRIQSTQDYGNRLEQLIAKKRSASTMKRRPSSGLSLS